MDLTVALQEVRQLLQAMPVQKELTGALMLMVQHMVIYYILLLVVNPERATIQRLMDNLSVA